MGGVKRTLPAIQDQGLSRMQQCIPGAGNDSEVLVIARHIRQAGIRGNARLTY